jgi:hypothetical protein
MDHIPDASNFDFLQPREDLCDALTINCSSVVTMCFPVLLVQAWVKYGAITLWDSLFGEPPSDPRVSFGFKEMYCDALMYPETQGLEQNPSQPCTLQRATSKNLAALADDGAEKKELPAPPRLTVYKTLTDVLNQYSKVSSLCIFSSADLFLICHVAVHLRL